MNNDLECKDFDSRIAQMEWLGINIRQYHKRSLMGKQLDSIRALAMGKFVPHASSQQKQQIFNACLAILSK